MNYHKGDIEIKVARVVVVVGLRYDHNSYSSKQSGGLYCAQEMIMMMGCQRPGPGCKGILLAACVYADSHLSAYYTTSSRYTGPHIHTTSSS